MVTVRGRNRKSIAPRMAPPRDVPERTESDDENELLEGDSTASNDVTDVTFIHAPPGVEADSTESAEKRFMRAACNDSNAGPVTEPVTEPSPKPVPVVDSVTKVKVNPPSPSDTAVVGKDDKVETGPTKSNLNNSANSNDSGHSDAMDTTEKNDDGVPGMLASVTMIEEVIKANYPITARPPCTVNAELVSTIFFLFIKDIGYILKIIFRFKIEWFELEKLLNWI